MKPILIKLQIPKYDRSSRLTALAIIILNGTRAAETMKPISPGLCALYLRAVYSLIGHITKRFPRETIFQYVLLKLGNIQRLCTTETRKLD